MKFKLLSKAGSMLGSLKTTAATTVAKASLATGLSTTAIVGGSAAVAGVGGLTVASVVMDEGFNHDMNYEIYDDTAIVEEDCIEYGGGAGKGSRTVSDDEDLDEEEVAFRIYSVMKEAGFEDNIIFGAIGNGVAESGLRYNLVEGDHVKNIQKYDTSSEEYRSKIVDNGGPTIELLHKNGGETWLGWQAINPSLQKSGYVGNDPKGHHWLGYGIFQWTGWGGVKPFFEWAADNDYDPFALDTILAAFMADLDEYYAKYNNPKRSWGSGVDDTSDYYYGRAHKTNKIGAKSPAEGAAVWYGNYEFEDGRGLSGVTNGSGRVEGATKYATILGKKAHDVSYGQSILSMANIKGAKRSGSANAFGEINWCDFEEEVVGSGGGHPYGDDYYLLAAFRYYNKGGTINGGIHHAGVDLIASMEPGLVNKHTENTDIYNVIEGTVVNDFDPAFGQVFVKSTKEVTGLDHDIVLGYVHLEVDDESKKWKAGDKVESGEKLGNEGETGSASATGCAPCYHLHFSVYNADEFESNPGAFAMPSGSYFVNDDKYGGDTSYPFIDPGFVIDGVDIGWFDTAADNYVGDDHIQGNALKIKVDGTTAEENGLEYTGKGKQPIGGIIDSKGSSSKKIKPGASSSSEPIKYKVDKKTGHLVRIEDDGEEGGSSKGTMFSPSLSSGDTPDHRNSGNAYPVGQCTWGAKEMAPWAGTYWGNGGSWAKSAASEGYSVGDKPSAGALVVWEGDPGHVGHVYKVEGDKFWIKESNYNGMMTVGDHRGTAQTVETLMQDDLNGARASAIKFIYPPKDYKSK